MYLSGVYIGQYKVLLELYLGSVPGASDPVYAYEHKCVLGSMDMCSLASLLAS